MCTVINTCVILFTKNIIFEKIVCFGLLIIEIEEMYVRRDISDVEMFLQDKHIDLWYEIYNVEKDELRNSKNILSM